jgi:hypothetical protein
VLLHALLNPDRDQRFRPPRACEMMARETAVAFDALAAMPNAFFRRSA